MNATTEAVGIAGAAAGVLTTGVALVAIFVPGLSQAAQIAIIAFGNAVILLGSVIWARSRVWSQRRVDQLQAEAEADVAAARGTGGNG